MENEVSERVAWRAREWARAVNLGMTSVWALISNHEIESVKLGNLVLITTSPREWIDRIVKQQRASGAPLPPIPVYKKATEDQPREAFVKKRRPGRPRKYSRN